jgi:hypothetical protein
MFDQEFCNNLPADPLVGVQTMTDRFIQISMSLSPEEREEHFEEFVKAVYAVYAYINAHALHELNVPNLPELKGSRDEYLKSAMLWFDAVRNRIQNALTRRSAEAAQAYYNGLFKNDHIVELTDNEHRHIQDLVDQLRKFLTESAIFDRKHKERLLARLEKLQQELHKTMSNIDRFWGFLSDAGIAVGRFGDDAKPMFDRAREIIEVLYRAQGRTAQLPGPVEVPQLPDYSGDEPQ